MRFNRLFFCLALALSLCSIVKSNAQDNETLLREIYAEQSDSVRIFELIDLAEENMFNAPVFALECAVKSVIYARNGDQPDELIAALEVAGKACFYAGMIGQSANFYVEQAKIVEQNGNLEDLAKVYNNLGVIYVTSGYNLDTSIYYSEKALDLYQQVAHQNHRDSLRAELISLYNNLGFTYRDLGNLGEGEIYLRKAVSLESFFPDEWRVVIRAKINLADILIKTNRLIEAQEILNAVDVTLEAQNDPILESSAYYYKGNLAVAEGALHLAASYFEAALAIAQSVDMSSSISYFANRLADLYKDLGAADKAIAMLELVETEEAKVNKPGAMVALKEFEIQQQFDRWEREINSQHQRKIKTVYLSAFIALSLGLVFVVLFFLIRKKHRITQLENMNLQLSLKNLELEKDLLNEQLEQENRKLFTETMYRLKRNGWIQNEIDNLLTVYRKSSGLNRKTIQQVVAVMRREVEENTWEDFELRFQNIQQDFMNKLHQAFPDLTQNERRLCAFLKLDMTTKEIASITGQSEKALQMARYRLRKKLGLTQEQSLTSFIQGIPS